MKSSKLFQLLSTFSPQEIHRFQLYLKSPYHNANPLFFQLFETIRPYLHSRNKKEIINKDIHKAVAAKSKTTTKFSNLQFNLWCSTLYNLAADFIALNQLETSSNAISISYLQVLNQRKLTDLFLYHSNKVATANSKQKSSPNYYTDIFFIQQQINVYQEILQSRTQPRNTAEVLESIEQFYLFQKIKYWSTAIHYKKMFDKPVTIVWEDFLIQYLQTNQMPDEQIEVARQILLLQQATDGTAHYQWLKNILMQTATNLTLAAKTEIYLFLNNHCIAQINLGQSIFYKELFELYQLALQQDLVVKKNAISPWDFKNIVSVALHQKEINWAEKFIKNYTKFLPEFESVNAYNYNLARVFFIQKKYNESLKLSQQVAYTDIFYQLDIKLMQAKTLYELNELDTLDDLISSFKKLLSRKRSLSKHYQIFYKNFLIYLQKILLINNKKGIQLAITQLNTDINVPDKNWLIEKLDLKLINKK